MKTFTFFDDSWFDNPPCDCCEGSWQWSYNSSQVNGNFGSAFSEEDCYLQAISTELGYQYWEDVPDIYRAMEYSDLKKVADILKLKVEIIS